MTIASTMVEEVSRDRPFNGFRCPKGMKAAALIDDVTLQLDGYERWAGLRQRRRNERAQATFEATVSAVICDVLHRHIIDPDGWVAVSLSKRDLGYRSRYRSPALGKTLPAVLERLAAPELAFLKLRKGFQHPFKESRQTTIKAGPRLVSRAADQAVGLDDLGRRPDEEVLILKAAKAGHLDSGEWLEYEDDERTRQLRAEVRAINSWLAEADIYYDGPEQDGLSVDDTDRHLKRYFNNGRFDHGGRLFGGFWQTLKKYQRRREILIDGHTTATLDYSQLAPTVLYGLTGERPSAADAYLVEGLEDYRAGVKKIFNALLFTRKPLRRLPQGTVNLLPPGSTVQAVVSAIKAAHAPVSDRFECGIGYEIQFIESQVMVRVLTALKDLGIVALPIHDAVCVARPFRTEAELAMKSAFQDIVGVSIQVREEGREDSLSTPSGSPYEGPVSA